MSFIVSGILLYEVLPGLFYAKTCKKKCKLSNYGFSFARLKIQCNSPSLIIYLTFIVKPTALLVVSMKYIFKDR